MKWRVFKHAAGAAVTLCPALSARAAQITGDITLSGDYAINGGNLGTATAFTGFNGVTAVPEGGATVILLGVALSGLGLIRRKLA